MISWNIFSKELSSFWNMIVGKSIHAVGFIYVPCLKLHNQLTLLHYTDFPPFHFFPSVVEVIFKLLKEQCTLYKEVLTRWILRRKGDPQFEIFTTQKWGHPRVFEIDSWTFQQMLDLGLCETSQNFSSFRQLFFHSF